MNDVKGAILGRSFQKALAFARNCLRQTRGAAWRLSRKFLRSHRGRYRLQRPNHRHLEDVASGEKNFAVVIPVIHPAHANIEDFTVVERHLELTVASIAAQTHGRVTTIVVGHHRPGWVEDRSLRAKFIDIGESEAVRGQLATPLDKGIKTLVGAVAARHAVGADVILTVDADDLLAVDLASRIDDYLTAHPGSNGVVWTRGFEMTVAPGSDEEATYIDDAYVTDEFNQSCGTCRAITMQRIETSMIRAIASLRDSSSAIAACVLAEDAPFVRVASETAALLDHEVANLNREALSELDHLGRHVTPHFALDELALLGAAKMCGHGQHDGPRGGGVHWPRVLRRESPRHVLERCGLDAVFDGASHR